MHIEIDPDSDNHDSCLLVLTHEHIRSVHDPQEEAGDLLEVSVISTSARNLVVLISAVGKYLLLLLSTHVVDLALPKNLGRSIIQVFDKTICPALPEYLDTTQDSQHLPPSKVTSWTPSSV